MTKFEAKRKQQRTLPLLILLLALGLRVFYVPVHLAQKEHLGPGAHHLAHASTGGEHADDGHQHDEDHVPHPAIDHATDLIAQKTLTHLTPVDALAPVLVEVWSLPLPSRLSRAIAPELRPPEGTTHLVSPPRGPPATA